MVNFSEAPRLERDIKSCIAANEMPEVPFYRRSFDEKMKRVSSRFTGYVSFSVSWDDASLSFQEKTVFGKPRLCRKCRFVSFLLQNGFMSVRKSFRKATYGE